MRPIHLITTLFIVLSTTSCGHMYKKKMRKADIEIAVFKTKDKSPEQVNQLIKGLKKEFKEKGVSWKHNMILQSKKDKQVYAHVVIYPNEEMAKKAGKAFGQTKAAKDFGQMVGKILSFDHYRSIK